MYEKLFATGMIGSVEIKNRIVMPPMGTSLSSFTGEATDEVIRYYEERAKGGCGLIITEIARIDDVTGIGEPGQLSVTSGKYIRKLVQLTEAVHKYDSKIFLQLHHPGRQVSRSLLNGVQPVAPSAIPCGVVKEMPRALTTEECDDLVEKFIRGAVVAKTAGFDGVELHGAHGYLINEFLSPYTNKRTDKYGGDFFKRLTFLTSIVKGIQAACGPKFPVSVRISADEFIEGGLKLEDTIQIAKILEAQGVTAIDVSAGTYETGYAVIEPQFLPEGWKKNLAKAIREEVSIPVIAVNNLKYPKTAELFLEEGICDFASFGRAFLADPYWPNKAKARQEELIHKCIGCLQCFKTVFNGKPIECTVNPIVGRELRYNDQTLIKDGDGREVVVVGAGPGGMHAAIVLAKRGYRVTLVEKTDSLGGTLKTAEQPPAKQMIGELIKTLAAEIRGAGVTVILNQEVTIEWLQEMNPFGVVVACGGSPIVPRIEGVEQEHVVTAEDVLLKKVTIENQKVVIIGGGVTGLETAEVMAMNNHVTVVEMSNSVGNALYTSNRMMLLNHLKEANVSIQTNRMLDKINGDHVLLKEPDMGFEHELPCDSVVLALGVTPRRSFVKSIQESFAHVMVVGDANKPGQIVDSMKEANDKAYVF